MSRASQLAKDEADKVEAEDEPLPVDDPNIEAVEEGSEPKPIDDGQSIEAALKAFEKENVRHADELHAIMGDDFDAMTACEHCSGVGFEARMPLKRDPTLVACDYCDARGFLLTPSLVEGKEVRQCAVCMGEGFVAKPYEPAPVQQPYVDPNLAYQQPPNGSPQPLQPAPPPPGAPGWAPGYTPPAQPYPGGQ